MVAIFRLFALLLLLYFSIRACSQPLQAQVPCFFIFGDSLVDNGNNNGMLTLSRANYRPYGIDFPLGTTGRFTNGQTYVDALGKNTRTGDISVEKVKRFDWWNMFCSSTSGLPNFHSTLHENKRACIIARGQFCFRSFWDPRWNRRQPGTCFLRSKLICDVALELTLEKLSYSLLKWYSVAPISFSELSSQKEIIWIERGTTVYKSREREGCSKYEPSVLEGNDTNWTVLIWKNFASVLWEIKEEYLPSMLLNQFLSYSLVTFMEYTSRHSSDE